jgi:hypothetical protein
MAGEKRLDTFGTLPVSGGSRAVERRLPPVPVHVANPSRRCSLVDAGGAFVRLGRVAERLRAGGKHPCGGSVRLGRVALSRCHPLPGGGGPPLAAEHVSFPERLKPRADGVEPGVDLPPTAWPGPGLGLAVRAS